MSMRVCHTQPAIDRRTTPMTPGHNAFLHLSAPHFDPAKNPDPRTTAAYPVLHDGKIIANRYELTKHLGTSYMAAVWKAVDLKTGREKVLKFAANGFFVPLKNEKILLTQKWHALFPEVYELDDHEGFAFLVMEFIDGGTLKERMDREKIPLWEVIEKVMLYLGAANALHKRGVVHRDFKPENIMANNKILDFGLSCNIGNQEETGNAIGTPAYLSPEQANSDIITQKADVYSLGIIFFEMITGSNPMEGKTPHESVRNHQTKAMPPLPERPVIERFDLDRNTGLRENVETLHYRLKLIIGMMDENDSDMRVGDTEEIAFHLEMLLPLAKELAPYERLR